MNEREIFANALQKETDAERSAYLDEACAGDTEMRRRIEALLQEKDNLGSFLESPARGVGTSPTIDQPIAERPGTVIGRYKLLEQIGEGGFGVVFMAEQEEPVCRKVALKIIKPGMDTKEVIARFEAERQALAIMDHANIAKVLDAGATESGRPYFVMELVRGIPITAFCDQNSLTTRERLELFAAVCQAVQHAHQKGIIHRDIKPSNVLVTMHDERPVPKVIDFGVAKATNARLTERTLFTRFAQMVGTPLYMSPEQAQMSGLDVDTRSDIYSLGVLLYELLTGTTPFDQKRVREAAYDELLRIIREEEPPKPSLRISTLGETLPSVAAQRKTEPKKLSALVRGELDWIVMKALEKDRSRRYETASGLAHDIENYLHDEPVLACPPSAGYRLRKFARRNKLAIASTGIVAASLVFGLLGTSWQAIRATTAERLARENEQHALENEQKALDERDQKEVARREALASTERAQTAAEAERQAKLAEAAQRKLAEVAANAERNAREAETTQRLRAEDNVKLAIEVLDETFLKEARLRVDLYTQDSAGGPAKSPEREKREREFLEKGLRFYEKLAETNATDWTARRERAKAYANVALLRLNVKDFPESEKAYRQAVHLMDELAKERPQDFDNRWDLVYTCLWSFKPYAADGRLQPAEEILRQALALSEKLAADFPDRALRAQEVRAHCQWDLASVLHGTGKPQEAEKYYRADVTHWENRVARSPKSTECRTLLSWSYAGLTETLLDLGQHAEAAKIAEKLPSALPDDWQGYSRAAHFLAHCVLLAEKDAKLSETDRKAVAQAYADRSRELMRHALALSEKLAETNATDWTARRQRAKAYADAGLLRSDLKDLAESEKAYGQAVHLLEELAEERPSDFDNRFDLAYVHTWIPVPSLQAAEQNARRALTLFEKLDAEFPGRRSQVEERIAACQTHLAGVLQEAGKLQEAAKFYRAAIMLWEKRLAEYQERAEDRDRSRMAGCCRRLTYTLLDLGDHREAAKIAEKLTSPALHRWQDYPQAVELLKRCVLLAEKDAKLSETDRKAVAQAYADRARELMREAVKRRTKEAKPNPEP